MRVESDLDRTRALHGGGPLGESGLQGWGSSADPQRGHPVLAVAAGTCAGAARRPDEPASWRALCSQSSSAATSLSEARSSGTVDALISAPVHSPVSGKVKAIAPASLPNGMSFDAVQIEPDEEQDFDSWIPVDERRLRARDRSRGGDRRHGRCGFPRAREARTTQGHARRHRHHQRLRVRAVSHLR